MDVFVSIRVSAKLTFPHYYGCRHTPPLIARGVVVQKGRRGEGTKEGGKSGLGVRGREKEERIG